MARIELTASDEPLEPVVTPRIRLSHATGSFVVSLAFWVTLLASAICYAAVALTPKMADWMLTRQQYLANAARLHELEEQADYLERVVATLKSDPTYAGHLAEAASAGTILTRSPSISEMDSQDPLTAKEQTTPCVVHPQADPVIFHLASHQRHRRWLLFGSGVLTIFAFTMLNDSGTALVVSLINGASGLVAVAVSRYRRPASTETSDESDE